MIPVPDRRLCRLRQRHLTAALLSCAVAPSTAHAQSASAVLPPTREEVTRPETQEQQNRALRLDVQGAIERAPCALDSPEFAKIRFTVRGAEFEGLQGANPQDLESSYSALVGSEQPISVVCEIRDRATALLRSAGYIAAVEVPEQRIADGVVRFHVVMARLVQVRVRGNASGAEDVIAGFLNQLKKQPVFNRYQAERYLLLASDLPGYSVRLTLRPAGTGPGEVLGDVTVQRTAAYADVNVQNGGTQSLGRWGEFLRGQLFGLTGLADRTTFGMFATSDLREQRTLQAGHDFSLGGDGLRLGGYFTVAWARPSLEGDGDLRARTMLATFQADYPLIRRLARTLRGSIGIDVINQDIEFNSNDLSRDRLRVSFARLGLDALSTKFSGGRSQAEPLWRIGVLLEGRKGLDVLGASDICATPTCSGVPTSRNGGVPTAAVVRGLLNAEYRPVPKLTLALGGRWQYAWKPLLSFEQFAAGNYTAGRGYDPGSLLGDRGWGTRAEIRAGSTIPASARKPAVESYLFFDHARVDDLDGLLVHGSNHLNSVGGGARASFGRFWLDAALAVPLTRVGPLDRKPDSRFLISLTTRLWPWSYK